MSRISNTSKELRRGNGFMKLILKPSKNLPQSTFNLFSHIWARGRYGDDNEVQ